MPAPFTTPGPAPLRRVLSPLFSLLLVVALSFGLGGCVTTGLASKQARAIWAGVLPWRPATSATRSECCRVEGSFASTARARTRMLWSHTSRRQQTMIYWRIRGSA